MNSKEAGDTLTADGRGIVVVAIGNPGTDMAFLQVFVMQPGQIAADGPYPIKAPGASDSDVIVGIDAIRSAVMALIAAEQPPTPAPV